MPVSAAPAKDNANPYKQPSRATFSQKPVNDSIRSRGNVRKNSSVSDASDVCGKSPITSKRTSSR